MKLNIKVIAIYVLLITVFTTFSVNAQEPTETKSLKQKAAELINQDNYLEALPILEKIAKAEPNDADTQYYLGFALLSQSNVVRDKTSITKLRIRARQAFVNAKKYGSTSEILDALIEGIPEDGSKPAKYSENFAAEELMLQGETEFAQGKYDEALKLYQEALKLDPSIYYAALYSGDMYLRKEEFDNAELWYQKAIKIDPNIETAYRYSATPLMKQKKYDKARERYIEALITEPYSKLAVSGISQWANATGTNLGHPRIDIPEYKVGEDGKVNTTININPLGDDGSLAWIGYSAERGEWREKKFAKEYPNEGVYRHTLKEEAAALRSVILVAKELKGKKTKLNPQLQTLIELDQKGLLESYILLAIPDREIAQDHADYLKNNRARLRQYVSEYVIQK